MKKIVLIATGGTISAHHDDRTNVSDYVSGTYEAVDWLSDYPELKENVALTVDQSMNISSTKMTPNDWITLRQRLLTYAKEVDGIVISHGTSTLEETAYFLHLTFPFSIPVVLTGAQRPYSAMSSDGPMNLYRAIQVAADASSAHRGVLVVSNDEIHSARDVTKSDTYRLQTFVSRNSGPLGYIDPDGVHWVRKTERRHTIESQLATDPLTTLPRVDIIYSYAGSDHVMIDALIASETKGIIVAGTGAGHMTTLERAALERATCPVVLSSRTGNGRVVPIERYADTSFIAGDDLSPQHARILLQVALALKVPKKLLPTLYMTY